MTRDNLSLITEICIQLTAGTRGVLVTLQVVYLQIFAEETNIMQFQDSITIIKCVKMIWH